MTAVAAFGPGRVNLIGEHTDYNDGLCLPFAIARGVTVHAEAIEGGRVEARAADLGEDDDFAAADPGRDSEGWRAFVRGTVGELGAAGHAVGGRAPADRGRPAARQRPVVVGGAVDGARAGAAGARGRARRRPPRAREAVLARGERLGRRRDGTARPARGAVRPRGPRAAPGLPRPVDRADGARPARLDARRGAVGPRALPRGLGLQRAPRGMPSRVRGAGDRLAARRAGRRARAAAGAAGSPRAPRAERERARRRCRGAPCATATWMRWARCSTPPTRACATTTRSRSTPSSAR